MEQQWLSFLVCTAQVPATSRARVRVQSSRSLPLLHRSTFWTPNSPSTAVTLAGSIRDTISARSVKEALGQVSTCREADGSTGTQHIWFQTAERIQRLLPVPRTPTRLDPPFCFSPHSPSSCLSPAGPAASSPVHHSEPRCRTPSAHVDTQLPVYIGGPNRNLRGPLLALLEKRLN